MGVLYLSTLLASLGCMLLIDRRFRLFFWRDSVASCVVTVAVSVFLLLLFAAGIGLCIFLRGESGFATGIALAPEMPLEEPVFLVFLVVCTMIAYTGAERLLAHRTKGAQQL